MFFSQFVTGLIPVSGLLAQDYYFVKDDTLIYRAKNLKEMLERDEIFSVSRKYDEDDGFNRIR
jgi:hypothetical protein